ncbi:hypothetical protein [Echinicola shivajiensis]|uniref:hypothetical protein n=1 Tax=Echinicola shivajiensis TaxID=1035916 RepID=UPI001BFC0CE8|nr:hypothetical protein [Echinicola shivajiensis]
MEIESTVMGLVGLALCIIPFVLLQRSRKKKEQELLGGLNAIADIANNELDISDFGFEFAIGVSADKSHVFYYKKTNEKVQEESIALEMVENCTIHTVNRLITVKDKKESIIEKLELIFLLKNNAKSRLEFFNGEEKSQLTGEMDLIKKWESIIHQCMSINR